MEECIMLKKHKVIYFYFKGLLGTYENYTSQGQRQIDEFIDLMREKMETEYA